MKASRAPWIIAAIAAAGIAAAAAILLTRGGGGGGSSEAAAPALPVVAMSATRPVRAKMYVRVDRTGAITTGRVPPAALKNGELELAALDRGTPTTIDALPAALYDLSPDLALADAEEAAAPSQEDPPSPPPPDPADDSDDDDSAGGSGTAMALDEGKMGKKDTDRAEGQYKMPKNPQDEQLARDRAIEQAKNAGILGPASLDPHGGAFASLTGTGDLDDDGPAVLDTDLVAQRIDGDVALARSADYPIVIADPDAPAHALYQIVRAAGGRATLAVATRPGGRARALAIGFGFWRPGHRPMTSSTRGSGPELMLQLTGGDASLDGASGTTAMKSATAWHGRAEATAIAGAFDKAIASPDWMDRRDLRVWFDDKATAGAAIAAVAALADRGADGIRVGPPRDGDPHDAGTGVGLIGTGNYGTGGGHLGAPTRPAPLLTIGQPSSVGDLDKAIIRRFIKRNEAKIRYCYEKRLLDKPGLEGTVSTQFFISPNGTVASSTASGLDPEVASCVADVLRGIEFPKPKGGGGVQVNYPFTFHSTGG